MIGARAPGRHRRGELQRYSRARNNTGQSAALTQRFVRRWSRWRLNCSAFDIEALDIAVEDGRPVTYVRQGGLASTLGARQEALRNWLGSGDILGASGDACDLAAGGRFCLAAAGCNPWEDSGDAQPIPLLDEFLRGQRRAPLHRCRQPGVGFMAA